jgi:hypothetical protein
MRNLLDRLIEDLRFFIGSFFLIVSGILLFEGITVGTLTEGYNLNLFAGSIFLIFALGTLSLSLYSVRR